MCFKNAKKSENNLSTFSFIKKMSILLNDLL
jgi:hypothetical protein